MVTTRYTSSAATILVAASDADPRIRNRADYVGDGVDDSVAIQEAIDSLDTTLGGHIMLSEGTFNIIGPTVGSTRNDGIFIRRQRLRISGAGRGTRLTAAGTLPQFIFRMTENTGYDDLIIEDCAFISNEQGTFASGAGIAIQLEAGNRYLIQRCYFEDWRVSACHLIEDPTLGQHQDIWFVDNFVTGVNSVPALGFSARNAAGVKVANNIFDKVARAVDFEADDVSSGVGDVDEDIEIAGNTFRNGDVSTISATNGRISIQMLAQEAAIIRDVSIHDNHFIDNDNQTATGLGAGIHLAHTGTGVVENISISNNVFTGIDGDDSTPTSILIDGRNGTVREITVIGNVGRDANVTPTTYGIRVRDATACVVGLNKFIGYTTDVQETATGALNNRFIVNDIGAGSFGDLATSNSYVLYEVTPTAYTQTFATADKTHNNPTAAALTDNSGGTASQILAAITGGGAGCEDATKNAVASMADEINKLITDLDDVKRLCNSIIDDLQNAGIAK